MLRGEVVLPGALQLDQAGPQAKSRAGCQESTEQGRGAQSKTPCVKQCVGKDMLGLSPGQSGAAGT